MTRQQAAKNIEEKPLKKEIASLERQTDLLFCTARTSKLKNAIVFILIWGKQQKSNFFH